VHLSQDLVQTLLPGEVHGQGLAQALCRPLLKQEPVEQHAK